MTRFDRWLGAGAWTLAGLASLAVVTGCAGHTLAEPDDGGADGPSGDAPVWSQPPPDVDGSTCVDISASSFDTSCHTAADCTLISVGQFCSPDCFCGHSGTINASGEAQYQQEVAGIAHAACGCPLDPTPQCLEGQCTLCDGTASDPARCAQDGGVDAPPDAPDTPDGPETCVDIDPTKYDQSCQVTSDCTLVTAGNVCTGGCACGTGAVNVSAAAAINQALEGVTPAGCPCAPPNEYPACVDHVCTMCTLGNGGPPGCPDAG